MTSWRLLSSRSQYACNSIKTFDLLTLYTIIPHTQLKSRIKELIQPCFSKKNREQMYQYFGIGRDNSYFVKSHSQYNNKYNRTRAFQWLDCLKDNIFVQFGERVFQQTICIPVGTICVQLLAISFSRRLWGYFNGVLHLCANVSQSNVELYNHILLSRGYTVLIHTFQSYYRVTEA